MWFPAPDPARAELYHREGAWGDTTLIDTVERSRSVHAGRAAVVDRNSKAITYEDLWDQSGALAAHFRRRGVKKGDIVTICLPNWNEFVVAMVAGLRLGAIVNPVPASYGRNELEYLTTKCSSAAIVFAADFRSSAASSYMGVLAEKLSRPPALISVGTSAVTVGDAFEEALDCTPISGYEKVDADGPAVVLFTSGTEARPKGVVHSHNSILFGERSFAEALKVGPDDVGFMASPIAHTTGCLHGVVMTLMCGGTLSLLDVFRAADAVKQMRDHACTWTMGATPFLADTIETLESQEGRLPALRYFITGGAPIPEALVKRAARVDIQVLAAYGLTESPPHTLVRPEDPPEWAWCSDGRPLDGIEVKIISPDGEELEAGQRGQELSRGPNTFLGYLDDPGLTEATLDAEGWVHSGDLAYRTDDGAIRVVGRLKDIIVRGGQNISVREVEDYLLEHPAIKEAAIVGLPHERLGETAFAVLVLRPNAEIDLGEVNHYLNSRGIAKFKHPEGLAIRPSLPVNASGKIQKFVIKQALLAEKGA